MAQNDLFSLHGQVAVVIGGGVLAGEMASGLAAAGADIAILDLSQPGAEARAASIRSAGRRAIGIQCDATSKADLEKARDRVLAELPRGE